jgi:hypothetical protein
MGEFNMESLNEDTGLGEILKQSKIPDAWKDIFILNSQGRSYFVPCQSLCLVESKSSIWILRTLFGDFILTEKGSALDMIMAGKREFNVRPTTLEIELLSQ